MPIEILDTREFAHRTQRRTVVLNTKKFHAWVHYYKPGQSDEMHCHNEDQTFYVVEGELTMRFPDGGASVLTPGMMATITGGSFYRLHNTGDEPLVMIGNRSGSQNGVVKIDYETRQPIAEFSRRMAEMEAPLTSG